MFLCLNAHCINESKLHYSMLYLVNVVIIDIKYIFFAILNFFIFQICNNWVNCPHVETDLLFIRQTNNRLNFAKRKAARVSSQQEIDPATKGKSPFSALWVPLHQSPFKRFELVSVVKRKRTQPCIYRIWQSAAVFSIRILFWLRNIFYLIMF